MTQYPIPFDYDLLEKLAEKASVKLNFYAGHNEEKLSMHKPMDLEGKQDKYVSFHHCYMANDICVMVKSGKLYACTLIPNLVHFNKYFNQKLEVTKRDYIDIHTDVTAEEIFDFLANPMPACRYCKVSEWRYDQIWQQSRRSIAEWT